MGEGKGVTANVTITDNAGKRDTFTSPAVNIDKTPPTNIIGKADRDPDHNGWFNKAVTISFTGADPLSGIASCTSGAYSAPDSAAASQPGSCTDMAGNTTAGTFAFKYDGTGPTAALAVTAGTVGANGWYTSDVTISTSGIDTVSGSVTCTADQQQTAETAGTTFNGPCTNDPGLTPDASALKDNPYKSGPAAAP